ncbi:MAG TPA: MmgE/PrpD family protein [Polyangiales bacterium]|nr:MmgE/PrpD family protein [Polyangiales bacterium]
MAELTRILARHLARVRYEDIPPGALHAAKRSLLDAVGVSLGASGLEPACAPFVVLARESPGPSQLLGFAATCSPLMAAFANGALAHALDYEDAYDGTPAHPNAASVPVALALADAEPAITGRTLLTALAAASDITCRLALALRDNPDRYGFYTPPILGAFGAAACAAKLLGLDEDRIVATWGLTLSQAMCSSQFKRDPLSSLRAVRDAFAANVGLQSARLAALGVRGFEAAFEGEHGFYAAHSRSSCDEERLLRDLGEHYLGERVSFKAWPTCRGTHAYIEAALQLRAAHNVELDQIVAITAHGAPLNRMLAEPVAQKQAPQTAIDAKFSIPFCVAVALEHNDVTLDDFTPAALARVGTRGLARRVSYRVDETAGMSEATSGMLELELVSGPILSARIRHPLGHPDSPLDDDRLMHKFIDCGTRAQHPLSAACARACAHALLSIEQADSARMAFNLLQ